MKQDLDFGPPRVRRPAAANNWFVLTLVVALMGLGVLYLFLWLFTFLAWLTFVVRHKGYEALTIQWPSAWPLLNFVWAAMLLLLHQIAEKKR